MKYKSEIIINGKVRSQSVISASNPQEVVRKTIRGIDKNNNPFMTIFVMNRLGDIWEFNAQLRKSKFEVIRTDKISRVLPRDVIIRIFAGNMSITRVI